MAARSTWDGAISLTFPGMPIPVKIAVRMFTAVSSRKSASFKMLDPVHKQPVHQVLLDCQDNRVERADTLKGVEYPKGTFHALPPEALELIEKVGSSVEVEVERFAPLASIPLGLALECYVIVPNEKVPGSEQPVQILWNGLRESQRAAVIPDWCPRAGARPSTLVIHAEASGLAGNLMPFSPELKSDVPHWTPTVDERAAQLMATAIANGYSTEDFDIAAYTDGYAQRRQAAIEMAVSGEPINAPAEAAAAPVASVPDLMSMLEASLADASAPAKPKKKAAAKDAVTA